MIEALREKVEREEQERPKVTLVEMASHIQRGFTADGACDELPCPKCSAAFDTLRKLDEEGPSQMADLRQLGMYRAVEFLRSLGVEPNP